MLLAHKEIPMPRPAPRRESSIDTIIRETAERVVERVSAAVAKQVSALVQEGLERELAGAGRATARRGGARARRRVEITRWVADTHARRVPNFVIEQTGLDTKKKIVARFGENATFERGKPLPKAKAA
jgi:hypothetical protein